MTILFVWCSAACAEESLFGGVKRAYSLENIKDLTAPKLNQRSSRRINPLIHNSRRFQHNRNNVNSKLKTKSLFDEINVADHSTPNDGRSRYMNSFKKTEKKPSLFSNIDIKKYGKNSFSHQSKNRDFTSMYEERTPQEKEVPALPLKPKMNAIKPSRFDASEVPRMPADAGKVVGPSGSYPKTRIQGILADRERIAEVPTIVWNNILRVSI